MSSPEHNLELNAGHTCCPSCGGAQQHTEITRRGFLGGFGGATLGSMALAGMTWSKLSAAQPDMGSPPPWRPLKVKPIFMYRTYQPKPQRSWRSWGGIQTQQDADREVVRIQAELDKLKAEADFPVEFLPIAPVRETGALAGVKDIDSADVLLVYAAAGDLNAIGKLDKVPVNGPHCRR